MYVRDGSCPFSPPGGYNVQPSKNFIKCVQKEVRLAVLLGQSELVLLARGDVVANVMCNRPCASCMSRICLSDVRFPQRCNYGYIRLPTISRCCCVGEASDDLDRVVLYRCQNLAKSRVLCSADAFRVKP